MSGRTKLGPFRVHVTDQILAALAEAAPLPLSTPAIEDRTGYGRRYGQLVYQTLIRLTSAGEAERVTPPGTKPCYWRHAQPTAGASIPRRWRDGPP